VPRPVRITPPAMLPVSLEEFTSHARIDVLGSNADASAFLDAAVSHLDGYSGVLGRCMVAQGWRQDFSNWHKYLKLPFPDVSEVTISYLDEDGVSQDVDSAVLEVIEDQGGTYIKFKDAFSSPAIFNDAAYPISVSFTAGYGVDTDVPAALRVAIKLLAAHWYESREAASANAMNSIPYGVDALIAPYRRVGV